MDDKTRKALAKLLHDAKEGYRLASDKSHNVGRLQGVCEALAILEATTGEANWPELPETNVRYYLHETVRR